MRVTDASDHRGHGPFCVCGGSLSFRCKVLPPVRCLLKCLVQKLTVTVTETVTGTVTSG